MNLKKLVLRNRSFRRFVQNPRPNRAVLQELVETARMTASGGNLQPIRYWLVDTPEACATVFPLTRWAGLLKEWDPAPSEAPTAYILVLSVKGGVTPQSDAGIAMQTLLLAAAEQGLGGCILGSIERPEIAAALSIPDEFEILYAVALGKPAEQVIVEDAVNGGIDYYRTPDGVHHVPKLPLETLIVNNAARCI